jgi:hypothetical protein
VTLRSREIEIWPTARRRLPGEFGNGGKLGFFQRWGDTVPNRTISHTPLMVLVINVRLDWRRAQSHNSFIINGLWKVDVAQIANNFPQKGGVLRAAGSQLRRCARRWRSSAHWFFVHNCYVCLDDIVACWYTFMHTCGGRAGLRASRPWSGDSGYRAWSGSRNRTGPMGPRRTLSFLSGSGAGSTGNGSGAGCCSGAGSGAGAAGPGGATRCQGGCRGAAGAGTGIGISSSGRSNSSGAASGGNGSAPTSSGAA